MAGVNLKNLTKQFENNFTAVDNISLQIHDREFMVLVGPSGCGKTTTLRMIAGLEEITKGTVSIGDVVVNEVPPKDRDIAMVFQNYALYPHMTVFQNMAFGLKLRKYPKAQIQARVTDTAKLLGIETLLQRKPKALSGGQRQRVALGRAIVRNPKAFLFDEPLSNLDAKLRVTTRAELKALHHRLQTTSIYVTHDQAEAMTLGDRICVMYNGRIQQVAPPVEVYDNPVNRFVAGFLGTPPMNFLQGRIYCENTSAYFVFGSHRLPLPPRFKPALLKYKDSELVMGIRPESLKPVSLTCDDSNSFPAQVHLMESLGSVSEVYLTCETSGRIIASIDPHTPLQVNDNVRLSVDMEKIHLFELGELGSNILAPAANTGRAIDTDTCKKTSAPRHLAV